MAPNSNIIIIRHAQAEHNVFYDYSIHDAPLTALGKEQAASLSRRVSNLQQEVDLIITSPLKRTLQTTRIGWAPAIERLGGIGNVICLPELQECNNYACDTGSSREMLEADPKFAGFNFERLTPEWTSKKGFWGTDQQALDHRAKKVRQFLRDRPEKNIVVVSHGGIIRRIAATPAGPSSRTWWNAEVRIFQFNPESVQTEDCWLHQTEDVAVTGGYGPTGAEIDIDQTNGSL
ncbi:histidine phosphatase superfamily [Xylaria scruposa]|nr:histidine phosphatase superfamily [Xylaria scruposa]